MLHNEASSEQLFHTNLAPKDSSTNFNAMDNLECALKSAMRNDRTKITEPSVFSPAETNTLGLSLAPAQVPRSPRDGKNVLEPSPPTTPKRSYYREEKPNFAALICCEGLTRFDSIEIEGFGKKKEELSPQQLSREKRQIMFRKLSQGRHEEMESFRALLEHADDKEIANVVKKVKVEREEEVVEVARKISSGKSDGSEGDLHLARATIFYSEA